MKNWSKETKRAVFWLIVGLSFLLILTPFILNRARCLESTTEKKMETFYDFSESGMGVWQQEVERTICLKWSK